MFKELENAIKNFTKEKETYEELEKEEVLLYNKRLNNWEDYGYYEEEINK